MRDLTRITLRDLSEGAPFVWPELLALVGMYGDRDSRYGAGASVFELTNQSRGPRANAPHGFVALLVDPPEIRVLARLPLAVVEASLPSRSPTRPLATVFAPAWAAPWVGDFPNPAFAPTGDDIHELQRMGGAARAELGSTFRVGGSPAYWSAYCALTGRPRPERYTRIYPRFRHNNGTPVAR